MPISIGGTKSYSELLVGYSNVGLNLARKNSGPDEQPQLLLVDKPDEELNASELARAMRQLDLAMAPLRNALAPLEARQDKLKRLNAAKLAAAQSRLVRGAKKIERADNMVREALRLQAAGEAAVTEMVAKKFKVSRRSVQRALKAHFRAT